MHKKMNEQKKLEHFVLPGIIPFPPIFIPAERMNRRDASVLSGEDPFTLV